MDSDVKCCLGVILVFLLIVIVVFIVFHPSEPEPIESSLRVGFFNATIYDGTEYHNGTIIVYCEKIIPDNVSDEENSSFDDGKGSVIENATLEVNITHDNITETYVLQTDSFGRGMIENVTPGEYTVSAYYAGNKTYNSSSCITTGSIKIDEMERSYTSSSSSESMSNGQSNAEGYSIGGNSRDSYIRGHTYYRWVYV